MDHEDVLFVVGSSFEVSGATALFPGKFTPGISGARWSDARCCAKDPSERGAINISSFSDNHGT